MYEENADWDATELYSFQCFYCFFPVDSLPQQGIFITSKVVEWTLASRLNQELNRYGEEFYWWTITDLDGNF